MFNEVKNGLKKDGHIIDPAQLKERAFQNEKRRALVNWQIENECLIQPVLQPTIDSLKAGMIFTKTTPEQIKALKEINEIK